MADRIPIPMHISTLNYLCLSAVPVSNKITLVKLLGKIPSLVCPLFCCSQHLQSVEKRRRGWNLVSWFSGTIL